MIILSIDVGTRNFGYVLIETHRHFFSALLEKGTEDISESFHPERTLNENLYDFVKELSDRFNDIDRVYIEQQHGHNVRAVRIQAMLHAVFSDAGVKVIEVPSTVKLIHVSVFASRYNVRELKPGGKKFASRGRKKLTRLYCAEVFDIPFTSDEADALLQCISTMVKSGEIGFNF